MPISEKDIYTHTHAGN